MPEQTLKSADLIAGPPAANPPVFIAVAIVGLSLIAPLLFLQAGAPSPFFGIITLTLAAAGIISVFGAVRAQLRRRADADTRLRARIDQTGVTFHPKPGPLHEQHFPATSIETAWLLPSALIIQTVKTHPKPGRYVLRFGKLTTPRETLNEVLAALSKPETSTPG